MAALSLSGPSTGHSRQTTFSCGPRRAAGRRRHCSCGNRGRHNRRIRPARRRRPSPRPRRRRTGVSKRGAVGVDRSSPASRSCSRCIASGNHLGMGRADSRGRSPRSSADRRRGAEQRRPSSGRRASDPSPRPASAGRRLGLSRRPSSIDASCRARPRCARPSRCPGRAASRTCRAGMPRIASSALAQSELRLALEIVALGGRQRGARPRRPRGRRRCRAGTRRRDCCCRGRSAERSTRFASSKLAGFSVAIRAWPNREAISGWSGALRHRLAKRGERLGGLARFEQDLALELEIEGIVRPVLEQAVHLGQRLVRIGALVPGIGPGIAGRLAMVALRIEDQGPLRIVDIAGQLRLHPLEARLERRIGAARSRPARPCSCSSSAWMRSPVSGWV